jgi:hypothetical protein
MVTKANLDKIGHLRDAQSRISNARSYARDLVVQARDFIYRLGYGVTSSAVERVLKQKSLIPTLVGATSLLMQVFILRKIQNTFGEKFGQFGINPYVMLVVDLMHEFELGVWKGIFIHLLQLLYAAAPSGKLVAELDRRYVCLRSRSRV